MRLTALTCLHIWILFAAIIVAAEVHAGSDEQVPLRYERLDLRDGRKLTKVEIKYYDPESDRFYLVANRNAMLVAAALFPSSIVDGLRSSAPEKPRSNINQSRPSAPTESHDRNPDPDPSPGESAADPDPADAHFATAEARAIRYYRYEHRAGSNNIRVTALDFEWSDPVEVAGWPNRYRTSGTASLEYWDTRGRQFHRTTSEFEVTTELKPQKRTISVVDFSRKN